MYFAGAIVLVIVLLVFKKSGCFFKSFFTSALGGIGGLCAIWAVNYFIPLTLGVNVFSLAFSILFSVPGVIFLLLCKTFLFV